MPLCTSLQYPLQNRAKIQKKIEIYKKNQQNSRIFKSCTVSGLPISKGNFVGNVYLSVLRFPAPKPVCCYAERMDKPEKINADEYLTHPRSVSIRLL